MIFVVTIPILVAGAAGLWCLSKHTPKGVMIVVGVILNISGRFLSSQCSMVFGPRGERLGSLGQRLIADIALPLQILGVIAVIHGIIILFKRKQIRPPGVGQISSKAAPSASPDEPST